MCTKNVPRHGKKVTIHNLLMQVKVFVSSIPAENLAGSPYFSTVAISYNTMNVSSI